MKAATKKAVESQPAESQRAEWWDGMHVVTAVASKESLNHGLSRVVGIVGDTFLSQLCFATGDAVPGAPVIPFPKSIFGGAVTGDKTLKGVSFLFASLQDAQGFAASNEITFAAKPEPAA